MKFLDRLQPVALLALRVVAGTIMVAHGSGKVFGGLSKTTAMVAGLGLPGWLGYLTAAAEFGGGILLLAGLFTRLASLAIFINMLVAITKVHLPHGLRGAGGYEFPLALAAMAFALIFLGAGPISLDWVFFRSAGDSGRR